MQPNDDSSSTDADREDRLLRIVNAYTAAVDAGEKPDRRALMRRHPDLAADLSACLGGLTFLNAAAGQLAATAHDLVDPTAGGPQTLGDYRLLREIGRGGMGVVYEAEQISLGRRVALKVLPMAAALDSRQLQRFRTEAQAAAQLHHTHIVPVYAVGCERSIHFYAMQLIEGQSLADVIADMRAVQQDSASSSSFGASHHTSVNLSSLRSAKRTGFYRTVARLGLEAADALHHAHHAGIVHRDIKPANLLLDNDAGLWITDFGLAQFYAEENNLTQSADRPGTLRYMSPEQASGRAVVLDQRTDIYSLGVTLYELLTLERAVTGETREQLIASHMSGQIKLARSIDSMIPKELETILLTAYAKEPADRYATAGALAEDLRRFLEDKPILARPPSVSQRTMRLIRRHRGLAWTAVLILLLLAAAGGISTALVAREQGKTQSMYLAERDRALEAVKERTRAQRNFDQARDAVDFFTRVAANELEGRPSPEVRREMLEASLDYYQTFLQERRDDPASAKSLTQAKANVANLLDELTAVDNVTRQRMLLRLLAAASVADELKLTDDQRSRARQQVWQLNHGVFDNEPLGDPMPTGGTSSDSHRQRLVRLGVQIGTAMNAILSPSQQRRLDEIARQVRGPAALGDPDVTRLLSLTPAQREAMRPMLADYRAAARHDPRRDGPPDGPNAFDRFNGPPGEWIDLRQQTINTLMAQLDDSQRVVWQSLIGTRFADADALEFEFRRFHGSPGGMFGGGREGPGDFGPPPNDGRP